MKTKEIEYINTSDKAALENELARIFDVAVTARNIGQDTVSAILHLKNSILHTEHERLVAKHKAKGKED